MSNTKIISYEYGAKGFTVVLVALNILSRLHLAFYMIIADCDETFNYWEPLNFLLRGFGKQTWEYSPEYAIRSYAYLIPYYLVGFPIGELAARLKDVLELPFSPAFYQFYGIRIVALAGFTCYTELKLYWSLKRNYSARVANWYLLFSTFAPGMAHAGVALLPSSFAMQANTLALSYVLESTRSSLNCNHVYAIIWYLIAGIVGWPFALVLGICFGISTLAQYKSVSLVRIVAACLAALMFILAYMIAVDSYFYAKMLLVPINIVLYNVFGGEGEGPEIFGVEPFSYYINNLLLNFNLVVILAYFGLVANIWSQWRGRNFKAALYTTMPLWVWLVIFFGQPHKEERFLYPIYPYITTCAAMVTPALIGFVSRVMANVLGYPKFRRITSRALQGFLLVTVALVGIGRIVNLVENYSAPLKVFAHLSALPPSHNSISNICVAKEWYHVPTSMLLPEGYRLRFVRSGFDGLLPGDFQESMLRIADATSHTPAHMNNKNLFEDDKVISFSECDYYIDNNEKPSGGVDPVILLGNKVVAQDWVKIACHPMINPNGAHGALGRILYIPVWARKWIPYNVEHMEFCALERIP